MRVTFVLPMYLTEPIGGYKVVYEYANGLARRGHQVTIVLPREPEPRSTIVRRIKTRAWVFETRRKVQPLVSWFAIDSSVRVCLVPDLRPAFIPFADIVIATSWQTAEAVRNYPASRGVAFYLVYDYEFWMTVDSHTRQRMSATYRAGLKMIATSPAVEEMLAENAVCPTAYIPCGLDQDIYKLTAPIETRSKGFIGFPLRNHEFKGAADALTAAALLKQKYGGAVHFTAFGSGFKQAIPEWVNVLASPTDAEVNKFYNSLSIFMFPSHYEGWGLPGVEALSCGAALATTDSVGNREYARDDQTALVVPRQRPDLLAGAVERLYLDDGLRQRLAQQGNQFVQQYTWERANQAMEIVLDATLKKNA